MDNALATFIAFALPFLKCVVEAGRDALREDLLGLDVAQAWRRMAEKVFAGDDGADGNEVARADKDKDKDATAPVVEYLESVGDEERARWLAALRVQLKPNLGMSLFAEAVTDAGVAAVDQLCLGGDYKVVVLQRLGWADPKDDDGDGCVAKKIDAQVQSARDMIKRADEATRRANEEMRRANEEMRRANEEMRRANEAMEEATRRANEAMEEARQATRNARHTMTNAFGDGFQNDERLFRGRRRAAISFKSRCPLPHMSPKTSALQIKMEHLAQGVKMEDWTQGVKMEGWTQGVKMEDFTQGVGAETET